MKMKKTTAAIIATTALSFGLVGLSHNVMAKQGDPTEGRQCGGDGDKHSLKKEQKRLKRMTQKLDLTEQQVADIKAIYNAEHEQRQEHAQVRKADRKGASIRALDPSADDYQEQVVAIASQRGDAAEQRVLKHAEIMAKVHAVLTPEQQAKAAEHKARRHQERVN